jgi:hypothetical protein
VRAAITLLLLPSLTVLASSQPSSGQGPAGPARPATPADPRLRLAQRLTPGARSTGAKPLTSKLARSDEDLLKRTDATPLPVVVKLDYDPIATYPGTSPATTGRPLANSPQEQRYEQFIAERERAFLVAADKVVPGVRAGRRLRTVYGGLTITAPANALRALAALPGVVAVQADRMNQPLTDGSPGFIGADTNPGGPKDAGAGVIVGVLDTGVWPTHPSFADGPDRQPAPLKADGTPRACDFGAGFVCNRKLIGGATFLDTYLADATRAEGEKYRDARDSEGHGTHTASTAAGDVVTDVKVLGVQRGPIRGIASGAWLSVYKVCGALGCFASDAAAAVGQAIKDGVQVINYSISGGTNPFIDPVELAFLDAYAAGVFVAAAAGNEGPGAGTANHLSPWVTAVGASTQRREFASTLTLSAGGATRTFDGASITAGAGPAPVVLAGSLADYDDLCTAPAPAGAFTGKIVACKRGGNPRVEKGYNVKQGGAAGMILYNPALADTETDNHWLPAVHLPDGAPFLAFLAAHPQGVTGTFTAGVKRDGHPDVLAAFSSRGPAGQFIKPDLTAPGVQILAGNTPTPADLTTGPPGELFQAIAGTSMASPHVAGGAAWLKSRHPDWTPGDLKSALLTTATTALVKEDLTTAADPFDMGSGRLQLDVATEAGVLFDETPARLAALGGDEVNGVHLNLPSIDVPVLPGGITTIRTATNVSGRTLVYRTAATSPVGSTITVRPAVVTVLPGRSVELSITITSTAATKQYFGAVRLTPLGGGPAGAPGVGPELHLPVAFVPKQGAVTLASTCTPTAVAVGETAACTVTAHNTAFNDAVVDLTTTTNAPLTVTGAAGAAIVGDRQVVSRGVRLPGGAPGTPSLEPGQVFGYVPLDTYGIAPTAVGDEDMVNFDLPSPALYGGERYTKIGVTSNGYLVVGGGDSVDVVCCDLGSLPDPARPNNVLAPFWTDLDGTAAPGVLAGVLNATDGSTWVVVEWRVNVFGTTSRRTFQTWLRLGGTEEIGFAYPADALPADPGLPFIVGAENENGSAGAQLPDHTLPTTDLKVRTTAPQPGGSVTYSVTVTGAAAGSGAVTTRMDSPQVPGQTSVTSRIRVN